MSYSGHDKKNIHIRYVFTPADGREQYFTVVLDAQTLTVQPDSAASPPQWVSFEEFRCAHCPVDESRQRYCPVGVNLYSLFERFNDAVSCEEIDLRVETPRRQYVQRTSVQKGLSSLMGIYMAGSSCPVFEPLKPLIRYHLPLAGPEETAYRIISMYLMAQYFRAACGKAPDWRMSKLPDMLKAINSANRTVCEKFRSRVRNDAMLNAIVILNSTVDFMRMCFDEVILKTIEQDFRGYTVE
ncbi:MAG: hypothetical protein NC924_04775 [Candidatus Omnitrophica bacterium]|nr:hypothetical protein [Candidatus Omnitrophota bacterium]